MARCSSIETQPTLAADYLRRVAPEVRVPARELLERIAPKMIVEPVKPKKRGSH